ncbi:hypothetical protein HY992_00140 [Candidatus Micrarchaeota archaeon]|nr:hypothetical protein [Candidatus Micrarchaeota archaeon]
MVDGDAAFVIGMLMLVGLRMFLHGIKRHKEKQHILNTPTSKVQSAAIGFGEVSGKAEPIEIMESVMEKKPAITHKWILERWEKRGKHSTWVKIAENDVRKQFFVNDGTGRLLVDAYGANIEIPKDKGWVGSYSSAPPNLKQFFDSNKISTKGWIFEHKMQFQEWFLSPGDNIYAIGTIQDRPGEYAKGSENLIMTENKGQGAKMFYISDKNEKEVLDKYYKFVGLEVAGGIALFGISFFLTLLRFRML